MSVKMYRLNDMNTVIKSQDASQIDNLVKMDIKKTKPTKKGFIHLFMLSSTCSLLLIHNTMSSANIKHHSIKWRSKLNNSVFR